MNKRQFKQTLQEAAEEKVPSVDLWPEIERRVTPHRRWLRAAQMTGGLAGAFLVLAAVLLFASWMASFSQLSEQTEVQTPAINSGPTAATTTAWAGLHLTGSAVAPDEPVPGATLTVTLQWLAPTFSLPNAYVFLHLFDANGDLVAQTDTQLDGAALPGSLTLTTTHQLSLPATPGSYNLEAGVYDRNTQERIPLLVNGKIVDGGIIKLDKTVILRHIDMADSYQAGEAVYSKVTGVSPVAHALFQSCGLDDAVIEAAVRRFEVSGDTREVIRGTQSDEGLSWRKVVDVLPLTDTLYRVTCLQLEGNTPAPPSPQDLRANLRLQETTLPRVTYAPSETLELEVVWYSSLEAEVKVNHYLHLLDQNGTVVAEKDGPVRFEIGAISQVRFTETLYLPSTIIPGRYQLMLGLYERASGYSVPFSTAEGQAVWQGSLPVSSVWIEGETTSLLPSAACPASEPLYDRPPDDPNADPFAVSHWYVNEARTVWAGPLGEDGKWHSGSERVFWIRPSGSELHISGRRLDDDAPPLDTTIPCCYPTGFQVTALKFPTPGCWEVIGQAGGEVLRFVTEVDSGEGAGDAEIPVAPETLD